MHLHSRNLSEEEKEKRRKYGCEWYKNLTDDENKGKNEPHQQIKSYWRFLEISVAGKYKNIVFIKCAKISAFKRI